MGKYSLPVSLHVNFTFFCTGDNFLSEYDPLHAPSLHIQLHNDNAPAGGGKKEMYVLHVVLAPAAKRRKGGGLFNEWVVERGKIELSFCWLHLSDERGESQAFKGGEHRHTNSPLSLGPINSWIAGYGAQVVVSR